MFEKVESLKVLQQIIRGNGGGTGVAVRVAGDEIRKFKIKEFKICCMDEEVVVEGICLDMPKSHLMTLEALHEAFVSDGKYWVKPSFVYRNKGDCARALANSRISHLAEKIDAGEKRYAQLMHEAIIEHKSNAMLHDRMDSMMSELRKTKWFREQ